MKKKALLVVSFGTSYEETRKKTIDKIEEDLANNFPEAQMFRAFTSQMIINKLKKRDGLMINNPKEALNELVNLGFDEVLIQPTHIINGSEFEGLYSDIIEFKSKFSKIELGRPLLTSTEDYVKVVHSMSQIFPKDLEDKIILLMGHGSEHHANAAYPCLDYVFKEEGFNNVHIATVEGFPELDTIIDKTKSQSIKNVTLMPLMIVAGDHIQNDLVGDEEDSWKNILLSKGYNVDSIIVGMGEIEQIRQLFIEHAENAVLI
ncbi:sirohydrochlorin cobaltochelatase [Alkalibaculum sp. M08DMB]|uniref:Sirohydrochlorin cobaltochelatase n=1 Tax=Alkalibaculum sporogenes TaxID=2655001 RepID=A0A6A7KAH6_9FIRM|nr:sirohydrochlorin cobaltochelatase [Alkalibaculum sporogenes]MPW26281.1 sirohydrochlorin cobaltochelatase [Alkalibaculum sporogenes]